MRSPIKRHGGKAYLADWIISKMPEHTHYVEPYFGGGSVLFRKPFEGISEVINDVDDELMNFYTVLQSEGMREQLQQILELTPFSESEFTVAKSMEESTWLEPVRRAAHFFVVARQSRQGLGKDFATLSRNRTRRGMNEQVSAWLSAIEGLPEVHERLKRVVILNRSATDVIRQQDGPNTLFYLDPPYLHETRVTTDDYQHEMSEADHIELLDVLSAVQGKFLLSGYPSELYTRYAREHGWSMNSKEIDNKASSRKTKEKKQECLWMNFN